MRLMRVRTPYPGSLVTAPCDHRRQARGDGQATWHRGHL